MTKIKICGLTRPEEVRWILEEKVDYFGMVLFFPKSRRNNSMENAKKLLGVYREECVLLGQGDEDFVSPRAVAVTVSPVPEQIKEIEEAGFDMLQIHGKLSKEAYDAIHLPVIRAFNVTDMEAYERYRDCPKVAAYLFDAQNPGSGHTFDWKLLGDSIRDSVSRDKKLLFLAGGLHAQNVREAIRTVHPDVVDVSSGVEVKTETGSTAGGTVVFKDREKIREFVRKVETDE